MKKTNLLIIAVCIIIAVLVVLISYIPIDTILIKHVPVSVYDAYTNLGGNEVSIMKCETNDTGLSVYQVDSDYSPFFKDEYFSINGSLICEESTQPDEVQITEGISCPNINYGTCEFVAQRR